MSDVNIYNVKGNYSGTQAYSYTGTSVFNLGVPHYPTKNLRKLSSNLFKLSGTPLEFGQGLPIILDIDSPGYAQISFDYDVKSLIDDSSRNKNIYFDVKNADFNSTGNYVTGILGLVDSTSTSGSSQVLQHISNTSGKVELTIDMNKGDNLWFRMTPQDDTGGLYAVMSNLKITYFST